VKPEEVQWTGLGDFLAGKPSVTKSEIEDYLLNNRVELKEISLESVNPYPYKTGDEWQAAVSAAQRRGDWDEAERLHEAWAAEQGHGPAGSPKFERYTTPGGSNYRELLMTMPPTKKSIPQWKVVRPDGYVDSTYVSEESARIQASRRGEGYTIREAEPAQVEGGFRSSHYDQPNILAHTRVKDYEQDGQKILHVDEVQSDWHQAGRKQGYVGDVKQHVAYYDTPKGPVEIGFGKTAEEAIANADPGWKNLVEIKTRAEKIQKGDPLSVPDAPFKKNWHELMTRRILQEAADKGYSRVTFTTGRTQADRYDLSKQVDSISVPEIMQNSRAVKIQDVNGNSFNLKVSNDGTVSGNLPSAEQFRGRKLDEVIGKEMADKIMGLDKPQTFSGVDLKVGGEGMKGFYDNMMVKAFNKEGKKFGVKVEPYKLRAGREVSWEEWMAQEHPNVRPMDIIGTPREAQLDAEYEAFLKNGGGEQVWSMEIPPEMRAKKKAEGSPMFAAAPFGLLGAGAMTPDKDAQAAMIAENIRQTPLSAFDLNRKPQAEMRAPRYGLLADIADAFEAGSRNDLLGSGESAARVANALAYGQRPGVLDTIVGSFEAVDPITWASLFGAMSKGR
jgi:hypothetical protein